MADAPMSTRDAHLHELDPDALAVHFYALAFDDDGPITAAKLDWSYDSAEKYREVVLAEDLPERAEKATRALCQLLLESTVGAIGVRACTRQEYEEVESDG